MLKFRPKFRYASIKIHGVTTKKTNSVLLNAALRIANQIYELQAGFICEFQERSHVGLSVGSQAQIQVTTRPRVCKTVLRGADPQLGLMVIFES